MGCLGSVTRFGNSLVVGSRGFGKGKRGGRVGGLEGRDSRGVGYGWDCSAGIFELELRRGGCAGGRGRLHTSAYLVLLNGWRVLGGRDLVGGNVRWMLAGLTEMVDLGNTS